jgi:putative ABC transport system ATP-binding protein
VRTRPDAADVSGSDAPLVQLDGLTKRYGSQGPAVLENLDLRLARGEYLAVMGESGVGKSTLLNLLAGLDRPDAGRVMLEGTDITQLGDEALTLLRRRSIGFIFQAFHVLPFLNVLQNTALPLDLLGVKEPQRTRRARDMLEAVGLARRADDFPRALSGGEMQRVAIARALVHRPALVLADEPTGNLDPRTATHILGLLRAQLRDNGSSAILITHSRAAADTADHIVELDGRRFTPVAAATYKTG